ncbi:MAG: plasmid mobilization relaxosome protein MobC [Firmicutes bacterium]|nr:plasmid mobilization relaxosome protein MobC [Clostridia bacterium]MBQ5959606.1 plasmid mobilization relaxosome protein MobC [Bacillota bacterium]
MRRRNKQINLRLSADEYDRLKKDVMKSGLTVQTYLRLLIRQIQPKEMPSADLINVLKSLQRIGNNMNQIAIVANSKGFVDTEAYWENVERLQREVSSLLEVMY